MSSPIPEIDAEKLEAALETVALAEGYMSSHQVILVEAARAHLSTLPRWKEVEVEGWLVINSHGVPVCAHQHEAAALFYVEHGGGVPGDSVVRLTGKAKVRA